MKNVIFKGLGTLLLIYFLGTFIEILFYLYLAQLLFTGAEKLVAVLEPVTKEKVLKQTEACKLSRNGIFIKPASLVLNYLAKFYKYDFDKSKKKS